MLNHDDPTLKAIKQTYKRLNPNLAPDMTHYKVKSVLCDFEAKYMASSEESKISDTKNSIYAMKNVLKAGVYSQRTLLRLEAGLTDLGIETNKSTGKLWLYKITSAGSQLTFPFTIIEYCPTIKAEFYGYDRFEKEWRPYHIIANGNGSATYIAPKRNSIEAASIAARIISKQANDDDLTNIELRYVEPFTPILKNEFHFNQRSDPNYADGRKWLELPLMTNLSIKPAKDSTSAKTISIEDIPKFKLEHFADTRPLM